MAALRVVWAVMDAPAGKRMAPFLTEIVGRLRVFGKRELDDATAVRLCAMSAATIDRRLEGERHRLQLRGRSGTRPGSLLRSKIHKLSPVTDVFTGWTETRAVRNKAQKWVFAALVEIRAALPLAQSPG